MKQYVVYTRVSTEEQGRSGLGLEAQERDIGIYLETFSEVPWEVIGRFQDVLSGSSDDRPQLAEAIKLVRATGAELLVAKLDRLSRDVAFIATLIKDKKVRLRVAQMPNADPFQLHLYAALAEQERKFISERTKAALKAAKDRGVKLGGLRDKTMKRNEAIQRKAKAEAEKAMRIIGPLRSAGQTLTAIADTMNDMGAKTSRGGKWSATQVMRVIDRTA
ncbi:recombinase family protein [Mesorhizobium sp. M0244]|uniref:recombinase family protein n=1 Tax=Mesorhizobium sp. M0244 TaxID=2956926 RepID=UPI00333CA9CE